MVTFLTMDDNHTLKVILDQTLDSLNVEKIDNDTSVLMSNNNFETVEIDATNLTYIASVGLRYILKVRKRCLNTIITNVSDCVFSAFEMTGFTQILKVERKYREVKIDDLRLLDEGSDGKIYKLGDDTIIKTYDSTTSIEDVQHEKKLAQKALIYGVPTAISYNIVKVGDTYGAIFELINAKPLRDYILLNPSQKDEKLKQYVQFCKRLHQIKASDNDLPDMRDTLYQWCDFVKDYLPEKTWLKLNRMIHDIPYQNNLIHGDMHLKNVLIRNDELLLVDMATLCVGSPVFEFANIFNAYSGFAETEPEHSSSFHGMPVELMNAIWNKILRYYFSDKSEEEIIKISYKPKIIGYMRLMRRLLRRDVSIDDERVKYYKERIIELVDKTDSLTIDNKL